MYASVLFVAFLLGFVPMWLTARTRANERDAAQHALLFTQAASTLYTNLRAELDRPGSALSASQRDMLQPLLMQRDQTITLLARSVA